jgi:lipopolysaccharide/colanic/teichoic acid biosynthesis glycosyltransferase
MLDVSASLCLLVIGLPLFLAIALFVFVGVGWPVLLIQDRAGRGGHVFSLYKFRTMREVRDDQGHLLSDEVRLTRAGRFLRSSSLDELPEALNVLKGDMSLVGPRPLLPQYVHRYSSRQARRLEVRPGMTGWAQIRGRNLLSWDDRFELDVWYVDQRSTMLDLKILVLTIWAVFRREGIEPLARSTMPEFMGPSGSV